MSKPSESSQPKNKKTTKKKYLLIGGVFVLCALLLKRDAH